MTPTETKTRLALIIPTMDWGGAEKQLCLLAGHLPRDEFEPHVVLLTRDGPRGEGLREAGIPVKLIGKRSKLDPIALWRLRAELRRLRPHIVHTWLFAANSFGRVAARSAGVPHVVASERCVDLWKSGWHFRIDRVLARRTDAITTNSTGVRDFYAAHGICPSLFHVIPNGIEPVGGPVLSREAACASLGIAPERRLIVAVGRLWPQKRYRDLIWAAELLATIHPEVTLVIIGDGPQRGELLRHRDAVTTVERVRFVGNRDDVAAILPHAEAFWIASDSEGQSNALMEAMRAGVPVIASDIAGNRDLVVDGETGFLVPLGDTAAFARQTTRLLRSPEQSHAMSLAARRRIRREFSVEAMVAGHVRLYRRLVSPDRPVTPD